MDAPPSRDSKDPVVNVISRPATSAGAHGEQSKEDPIDGSGPNSHADSPTAADYTTIQIDQDNTAPSEGRHDTYNPDKLVARAFTNLANYSILRHQESLADADKKLSDQGRLDEAELRSLRDTLRKYYVEIRDCREMYELSRDNDGKVDLFPPRKPVDDFSDINDESVKYLVKAMIIVSLPFVIVAAMFRVVRMTPGATQRSLGDLMFSIEHIWLKIEPYLEHMARSIIAITGSMALLVPVLILSYVETLKYRLLTVCLSVIGFSICAMIVLKPKTSDLVAVVAAYTAVLVVYVGGSPA